MALILLVEDSRDLAQVIQRELEANGFEVQAAYDGASALSLAARRRPDLIILDWMLPGMDGLEVLRRLQANNPPPVLILTARSEEADRVIGLELGADDYLTKPFSMRELVARVRVQIRRTERVEQLLAADRQGEARPLQYGGLFLDPGSYTAELDGQSLDLSRTEFDMLHLFLRNPGRAFSRSYLLEAVWGGSYIEGDRSVDNAILRLRKKLGELGDEIETVWGVGYRLRSVR